MRIFGIAFVLGLVLGPAAGCSSSGPDMEKVCAQARADDDQGTACSSIEDCHPIDCFCRDRVVTTASCSGSCAGESGCAFACEGHGGYQCGLLGSDAGR